METLANTNREYWTKRAESYSAANKNELATNRHPAWKKELLDPVQQQFPGRTPQDIRVLDIGCGPGFFSIIFAQAGYNVTAVDYTPQMLVEARQNAADNNVGIDFRLMDAQNLEFPDASFDVVVSRNLTWDLPDPVRAYNEWARVLKPGGVLLNFDANWYNYLYEADTETADSIRESMGSMGMDGNRVWTDVNAMEAIALQLPLSSLHRPVWDQVVLAPLFSRVEADTELSPRVLTGDELEKFSNSPMFKIVAIK